MTDAREALPEPAPMPDDEASGMFQYWHREPGTSWADLIRRVEKKTADEWRAYTAATLREAVRKARAEAFEESAKVFDARDAGSGGFYEPDEPAKIIRALATKEANDAR